MKGFIQTNSKIQYIYTICVYKLIWDISSPATSQINSCHFTSPSLWFCVCHPGLEMAWVVRPPETVKTGEAFNVTYSVTARDSFYHWAVQNGIFTNRWMLLMCWVTTGHAGISLWCSHADFCWLLYSPYCSSSPSITSLRNGLRWHHHNTTAALVLGGIPPENSVFCSNPVCCLVLRSAPS